MRIKVRKRKRKRKKKKKTNKKRQATKKKKNNKRKEDQPPILDPRGLSKVQGFRQNRLHSLRVRDGFYFATAELAARAVVIHEEHATCNSCDPMWVACLHGRWRFNVRA